LNNIWNKVEFTRRNSTWCNNNINISNNNRENFYIFNNNINNNKEINNKKNNNILLGKKKKFYETSDNDVNRNNDNDNINNIPYSSIINKWDNINNSQINLEIEENWEKIKELRSACENLLFYKINPCGFSNTKNLSAYINKIHALLDKIKNTNIYNVKNLIKKNYKSNNYIKK